MNEEGKITFRSVLLGVFFAALFTYLTVYFENRKAIYITATQIAVLPYVLLFLSVLMLNPLLRLLRVVRRLSVAEILVIFIMGSVSSGISTFGLASQLVPVMTGLYNPHWNTDQSEWNHLVEPFINDAYFVGAVDGTQDAAIEYRDALMQVRGDKEIHAAGLALSHANEALDKARAALEAARADKGPEEDVKRAVNRTRQQLAVAKTAQKDAADAWDKLPRTAELSLAVILETYPDKIAAAEEIMVAKKAALREKEEIAFKLIDEFRTGLKKEQRAWPGFVPLPDEGTAIYRGRLRRLLNGVAARRKLVKARALLLKQGAQVEPVTKLLDGAVADLGKISDLTALEARLGVCDEEWEVANKGFLAATSELAEVRKNLRFATRDERDKLEKRESKLKRRVKKLKKQKQQAQEAKEKTQVQIDLTNQVIAVKEELATLPAALQAGDAAGSAVVVDTLGSLIAQFAAFDASYSRFFKGDIPWKEWVRPILLWGFVIGLTYLILMSFNVLIFRQWAHNERLIYPLAQLPELLAGNDEQDQTNILPPILRSGLFWAGFAISATVLGWNLLCKTEWLPGLKPLDLAHRWSTYIAGTPFAGLGWRTRSEIFFTMIGLAFLIPAEISFSLWSFWVLYMFQLLVLIWLGFGVSETSFSSGWWYTLNFRTAEGGGALLVFACLILWKCRRYLFCAFNPSSVGELEKAERRELVISSFLFIFASFALVLFLWLGLGANLGYTVLAYFVILVITIGLVRAVCEGGILGFQAWVSPFHFIRTAVGMKKTFTHPSLFAPLFVYYSLIFLDIKSFIAPAMANCIKIRDDLRMKRGSFHAAIWISILVAVVVSVVVHIILAYSRGADGMSGWFYTGFPKGLYKQIAAMTRALPEDNTRNLYWMLFGGGLMCFLIYFRQTVFWLPHPIGLVMLVNPIMRAYWFSIFLGWIAKHLVTKYGNKETYGRIRYLFVGLIAGELILCAVAMVVSLLLDTKIGIDLNRN